MAVAYPLMSPAELWYALQVRPRFEKQVAQSIRAKGIKTLLPTYLARRRWSDRIKELELPLFDGYVFCQVDPESRLPVLITPGVLQFVGIGKVPVPIDSLEIEAIERTVRSGVAVKPWPFMKVGDRVRIDEGPLRNLEGILMRTEGKDHLVVSVTLLQRSMAIRMERAWLTPVRPWLRDSSDRRLSA
jgi:transcription termination/antitermination protein NusG